MNSILSTHRILAPREPQHRYKPVGRCIYCRRSPPEVQLTDEHIIADGLAGNLLLPDSSCVDCARVTGRVEQQVLREVLMQPRGVLGIKSRKKRPKQTSIRMKVGPEGGEIVERDIPFVEGMPTFLALFVNDAPPGILLGAPKGENFDAKLFIAMPADFNELGKKTMGLGEYRFGFRMHAGVFGQMIAKTCHAYAVAELGIDGFEPFLANYITAYEPSFDGYHMASLMNPIPSDELHKISLSKVRAPVVTAIGNSWREVYVVEFRIFSLLSAPTFVTVVGRPLVAPNLRHN